MHNLYNYSSLCTFFFVFPASADRRVYPYWPRGDYAIMNYCTIIRSARAFLSPCMRKCRQTVWGGPLIATFLWCSAETRVAALNHRRAERVIKFSKMASKNERTYIMIKPDGVQRGLMGDILKRFEQKGFKLVAMKFMQVKY